MKNRLKLLRDLQSYPDGKIFLCHDEDVSAKHGMDLPFTCTCKVWRGGGLVSIDFHSRKYVSDFCASEMVLINTLEPTPLII